MCQVRGIFKLVALMASVTLAGCASSVARIDTWEGEPPEAGEAAVLKAPGEITVVQVNGQEMTNFLMDDLALDYGLLPGANEVVFTYKTIWAKAGVVDNGESKVHTVESGLQRVSFEAQAGQVYRFDFEEPTSRKQAEAMMEDFSADIVNNDGQVVASSGEWDGKRSVVRTPVPSGDASRAAAGDSGTTLEQLKALWGNASEEEKRDFLRWAFE
jgi:uncharacterized protein YccT (UPF0319 family)